MEVGEEGEREIIIIPVAALSLTPALRWAATRAILMFQ